MDDIQLRTLRITVPDEPGYLARIAATLSDLGGNIVDVDVHEIGGVDVVDDIVVSLPDDVPPAEVREALLRAGAKVVVSTPAHHRTTDVAVRCIDAMAAMLTAPDPDEALAAGTARLVGAGAVEVVGAGSGGLATQVVERGAPVTVTSRDGIGDEHLLALPYPEAAPTLVVVVRRRGMKFTTTEVNRLRSLLRLHSASVMVPLRG